MGGGRTANPGGSDDAVASGPTNGGGSGTAPAGDGSVESAPAPRERDPASQASDADTHGGRFRGVTELSLDAKGRLAIPARHRDGLVNGSGGALVLTADPGGCLLIFPRLAWEPLQQQLMSFSSFNETVRRLQRLLVGHADDVEIDAAGRILVPPALRRYAGLDKHVVLVGQGRKLELWDAARWQGETAQAIALPAELPSDLAGFSL